MKTNKQPWFEILKAARALSKNGASSFTSADLARAAELEDTVPSAIARGPRMGEMGKGSTAQQIAAGWLSKFQKWGYVVVSGKIQTGAPRPAFVYSMTKDGLTCELRQGLKARLYKLIEAVNLLAEVKGKAAEPSAWKELLKVVDEVTPQEDTKEEGEEQP
jgi:hypothetical protein